MLHRLDANNLEFPPTSSAMQYPNGLLAYGGDLSPARLLAAYRQGIFPWYEEDQPILWWSPDPRMVLNPSRLHVARSLHRQIRKCEFSISFNRCFREVIAACAAPRDYAEGTWITPAMQHAYDHLHQLGYGVSVEAWNRKGELAGGLYGIALGKVFYGESMFSRQSGASKIAFVSLARTLANWNYALIDCQVSSEHLASFGAVELSRREFEDFLPHSDEILVPDHRWQSAEEQTDMP